MSKFTDSLIGENLEVATEYFKSVMASSNMEKDSKTGKRKKSGGSIGFIPFNINFKMDGLSGIKIYNELVFDTSFLPPGYSTTLDFIVTGVDHQLKNGDWETDVKVTLVPKTDESSNVITGSISVNSQQESYNPPPVVNNTSNTSNTNNTTKTPAGCNPITFTPNDTSRRTDNTTAISAVKSVFPTLSKEARAALLGHLKAESQLNPTAYNSGGGGCGAVGMAQWRGNRQNNLFALATSKNVKVDDFTLQLEFVRQELSTGGNYWNKVWAILNTPGKTLLQYGAVVHLSYGLGSNNPDKERTPSNPLSFEYKKLVNVDNWVYVYKELNGTRPEYIPTRYQYMQDFLALM
jgi:hypothetical protein